MIIKELAGLKDGSNVTNLVGWVDNVRDHGGLTFIDLRDFDSTIQLVFDKESDITVGVKNEFYIMVSGVFSKREDGLINTKTAYGQYEIVINSLDIVNESKTLPFQIEDNIDTDESIRLKYRCLLYTSPSPRDRH